MTVRQEAISTAVTVTPALTVQIDDSDVIAMIPPHATSKIRTKSYTVIFSFVFRFSLFLVSLIFLLLGEGGCLTSPSGSAYLPCDHDEPEGISNG